MAIKMENRAKAEAQGLIYGSSKHPVEGIAKNTGYLK
jgi:hypothetical protein